VHQGGTIVVHSLARLGRNLDDLRQLINQLTEQSVRLEFIKEQLVFTGEGPPMAKLLLSVMDTFTEFERSLLREHQHEGIALAKLKGKYKGRKR
jgi:DNA invertase Pin-like site-specific DNA recombinase